MHNSHAQAHFIDAAHGVARRAQHCLNCEAAAKQRSTGHVLAGLRAATLQAPQKRCRVVIQLHRLRVVVSNVAQQCGAREAVQGHPYT